MKEYKMLYILQGTARGNIKNEETIRIWVNKKVLYKN